MSSASISIVNKDVAVAPAAPSPPHIAVLGCGPGGMFFCHAIELKRKVLQERLNGFSGGGGDSNKTATTTSTAKGPTLTPEEEADPAAALLRLPIVTVFEKSNGPGGVWRAQRTFEENNVVNTNNNTCTVKDNVKQEHVVANGNVNDIKAKTKTLPEDEEEEEDETSHTTLISSSSSSSSSTSSDTSPADSSPKTTTDQDCSSSSVKVCTTTVKTMNSNTVVQAAASAEMYEALWCNGPKEAIEFFDYTYRDHYGMDTKLPSYLSRAEMLNVMMQRVTRNNPHFFDAVKFNTSVEKVTYDDELKKFSVVTKYVGSMEETKDTNKITRYEHVFDKFIWAAGTYSRPRIPKQLSAVFQPFAVRGGRVIHSSNASRLQTDAGKDKHVLLIGGSYSAEDLCLMAIKLGAKHVTIACRSCDADVAVLWQSEWPGNKVTIFIGQIPVRVSDVSTTTDSSSSIKCTVEFVEYKPDEEDNEEESESESEDEEDEKKDEEEKEQQDIATVSTNVDTVIFCTGYESNWDMMDPSVYNIENEDEFERFDTNAERLQLPTGWTMPHNVMTDELKKHGIGDDDEHGNVTPSKDIAPGYYAFPYSYNEVVSIHNHNLFYFNGGDYDAPLMALDAQAFVMLAIITGAHIMPDSALEMKRINHEEALYEMTLPAVRFQMDKNYSRAIRQLPNYPWPKHWIKCVKDLTQWQLCRLGQLMRIGRYPIQIVKNGGTLHDGTMVLAEKGQALLNMDYNCRKYDTKASDNNTFRDIEEEHCRHLASIHTGAVPVPFGKLWMDIDDLEHAPNTV